MRLKRALFSFVMIMKNTTALSERIFLDFESDFGAIPWATSSSALEHNTELLSDILNQNASYSALVVPNKVFHFYPGIYAQDIVDFHLYVMGTLRFHRPQSVRDTIDEDKPDPCIWIQDSSDIVITSRNTTFTKHDQGFDNETDVEDLLDYGIVKRGIIDGYGSEYWGIPLVGYVQLGERRPTLIEMKRVSNTIIEYIIFKDAPMYTLYLREMENLKVRYTSVVARRTKRDGHGIYDLSAFNTDGIDVSGRNVHIHDVDIWNQDDCIAVKDSSSDMLFERIVASGLGLTVGSIGGSTVRNITFRDSFLHRSFKGIHMKFRENGGGLIEDITFDNITIVQPEQWGIWIGPAQQSISGNICDPNPCSLCWPAVPFSECNGILESQFRNITLKDVHIYSPMGSPGVILAHEADPIDGMIFHNVLVFPDTPERLQNIDKLDLFPGLKESVNDKYMQSGYIAMYIICILLVIGSVILFLASMWICLRYLAIKIYLKCNGGGVYTSPLSQGKNYRLSCLRKKRTLVFLIVGAGVTSFLLYFSMEPHIQSMDVDTYYTCEGVRNATATGDTWPIPFCFEDRTKNR